MKLKSMHIYESDVFGSDFFLSFCDASGKAVDTIILAGENGCGKTSLLEAIYDLGNYLSGINILQNSIHKEIEYIYELSYEEENELIGAYQLIHNLTPITSIDNFSIVKKGKEYGIYINTEKTNLYFHKAVQDLVKKYIRIIYSNVEVNYTGSQRISGPSAIDLDQKKSENAIKSSQSLGQEITQLFVNISSFDNADLNKWVKKNPDKTPPRDILEVRQKRFSKAFDAILTHKKYKEVYNSDDGQYYVIFDDHGKDINIHNLSSGEKQIVFRGGFLIKDKNSIYGSTVLIDEPEISLHPIRQLSIADFYKKLFTDEQGNQTSQIFFSTHSPFIIHNDKRYEDLVIILKKDAQGNIIQVTDDQFYNRSGETLVQKAFDIDIIKSITIPTVFVEGYTDQLYFEAAKKALGYDYLDIDIKHVGDYNQQTKKSTGGGQSNLTKINDFITIAPGVIQQKVYLIYDCDCPNIPTSNNKNVSIMQIPTYTTGIWDSGIENALVIDFDTTAYIYIYEYIDKKNKHKKIEEEKLRKIELCSYICQLDTKQQQKIFRNFGSIFKKI